MIIKSADAAHYGGYMKKNLGPKSWLYPEPVLIIATYDESGREDAMNAAWGGIADDNQISICLSPEHKTVKNILAKKAFSVSIADARNVVPCDFVGIVSGNDDPDKMKKAGFHFSKAEHVDAPIIDELPFALECKLLSYDEKTCRCWAEIVNVCADESILGKENKIDLKKFEPIIYDPCNHDYYKFGEKVGKAFSSGAELK